jgi:hypothetical protein
MQEEFENNTGVIKIRKAKMDRQHYGQQLKDKITNNGQAMQYPEENKT